MRVSIVIAAHNEGEMLWKTVRSVMDERDDLEADLLVVDDASTDESMDLLTKHHPDVRVHSVEQRRGASPSKHLGAQSTAGDVLIFLDGHCNPEPGALRRLAEAVDDFQGEAIITPTVTGLDVQRWENSRVSVGHGYRLELERFDCQWVPQEQMKLVQRRRKRFYENPALIGCAFAVSRSLYQKLRGFDAAMQIWGSEDVDFGLKCWLMGHRILHLPEAVIGHRFRQSFDNYEVSGEHVAVNQLRMARKNFTDSVWGTWLERSRPRFQGQVKDHPEGLWARVWELFQSQRTSLEEERAYLLGHRAHDEFWYAEYFGLPWPQLGEKSPVGPLGTRSPPSRIIRKEAASIKRAEQAGNSSASAFFDPSPSPPPPHPSSSSSSSSGGGGGSSTSSSSSSSSTSGGGGGGSSSSSSSSSTSGGGTGSSSSSSSSRSSSTSGGSLSSSSSTSSGGGGGGSSSSSSSISPKQGTQQSDPPPACNTADCTCPINGGSGSGGFGGFGGGIGFGGTPRATGWPVNYLNGNIVLSATDIFSSGFGASWSHQRTYSNQLLLSTAEMGQGTNWVVSNWPFLVEKADGSIALVRGTTASLWFDLVSGSYVGRYGSLSTLVHDDVNHLFVLTSPDGTQQTFHDFDQAIFPPGEFAQQVEPGGFVTSVESYTDDGLIEEIHRTGTVGGQPLTEAFVYVYTENNQVETLTLRRQLGSGGWDDVKRAVYRYWDGTNTYGNAGDLQLVTIQTPTSTGWADSRSTVYRYYIPGQANGFPHGLKFVINPATYQRMLNDSVNPLTASDVIVATYADNYYEFDGSRRVTLERTDGGTQTFTLAFTPGSPGGGINDWAMKTVEGRPDGSQKIVYTNSLGQALIEELVSGSDSWIDAYHYDENSFPLWHAHPSAVLGYSDSSPDLDIALRSSAGLIEVTTYYTTTGSGAAAGYVSANKIKQGSSGAEILLASYEYTAHTAGGTTVYPVSKQTVYRNSDGTGGQVTTYDDSFYSGTTQIQQQTTTLPIVSTGQNGTGVAATRKEYYDEMGRLTWSMDERGFITQTIYDLGTGGIIQQVQDVNTSAATGVPSGWTTPAGGGLNLVTDYLVDDQGRTIQSLSPAVEIDLNGTATTIRQASWTVYDDENHVTYSGQGYLATATSSSTLINPVAIQQMDDGGKILASISAVASETSGTLQEIIDAAGSGAAAFPQSSYVRLTTTQYTQCCLVASERVYFNIPTSGDGTEGTNYNQSNYGYDSMQRRNRTVTPGGTITDVVFDARGLVVSTYVGTNDDGATESDPTGGGLDPDNNMVLISSNVYDNGNDGGDGNLTQQTQYADATDTRVTAMTYDFRSRLITTDGEIDYFQKNFYDNLDQQIKVERYDTTENGNLIARSETLFDDRGRQYRTIRYGVNPSTGIVGNALTSNTWYDAAGNSIQSLPAGSKLFAKTTYDSLGRPAVNYSGYTPTGTTNDPTSIDDDVILEQSEPLYDDASNVIQTTAKQRYHDAPDTQLGALGDPSTTPKARVTYAASYPDALGRTQASAHYGTNGGTALARSSTIPARSDTILVNSQTYDDAGNVFQTTDPMGMVTRMAYDDAGRQTSLVENYQPGSSSSSSSGTGCTESDDTNRMTMMSYTPDNKTASLTAVNLSTGNQVTQYVYGTTLNDSEAASSLLLRKVVYPDSTSDSDVVQYTYNRLAQRTSLSDQIGNMHMYDYDKLGRPVHDRVTILGSGVDGAVRRFSVDYNVRGLVQTLSSIDNPDVASGSPVNQVEFTYNDFGQSINTFQAHSGTVDPVSTPSVGMNYATGADNTIRPMQLIYPNGRRLYYSYGAPDGNENSTGRIAALIDDDDTTNLAEYSYLGLSNIIQINSPQADLQYTLVGSSDDPHTGDIYAGLDRFGRIKDCRWRNTNTEEDLSRIQYGYDRDSNRIWRKNHTDPNSHYDWLYAYDGLQRLKNAQRGTLNGSHTAISDPQFGQCWTLDETGNWTGFRQDDDGTGWSLIQERTASPVNEITDITNTTGPAWAIPAYDRNGNMTTIPLPNHPAQNWSNLTADGWGNHTADGWSTLPATAPQDGSLTATYDAWNRMVTLTDAETSNTVQENQYDARNYRIVRKDHSNGTLSETRHFYYTDAWQDIEQRLGSSTNFEQQNVWGIRYIDDLVLRDRTTEAPLDERLYACQDANWNVTAIVDTDGAVPERFEYDPYGNTTFLESTYTNKSTDLSDWSILFSGYKNESRTNFYLVRNREYLTSLGSWNQRDRLGYNALDTNLFAYIRQRPLTLSDPSGNIAPFIAGGAIAVAWYFIGSEELAHAPGSPEEAAACIQLDRRNSIENCHTTVQLVTIPVGGFAAGAARTCSQRVSVRIICCGTAGGGAHQFASDLLTGQVSNYINDPSGAAQAYGMNMFLWGAGGALGEGFECVRPCFGGRIYNIGGAGELPPRPNLINQQPPSSLSNWGGTNPAGGSIQDLINAGHQMHIAPNVNLGLPRGSACRVIYQNMPPLGSSSGLGPLPTAEQLIELAKPNRGFQFGGQVYVGESVEGAYMQAKPIIPIPSAPICIQGSHE